MSRREMSKWLCFIASMPRSNSTLSGCLESTLARGLLTFLLVQAVVSASVAARAITEVRGDKCMKTSKESGRWSVISYISDQLQMIRAGHREHFVLQLATNHWPLLLTLLAAWLQTPP